MMTRSGRVCNRADEVQRKNRSKNKGKMVAKCPRPHGSFYSGLVFYKGPADFTCQPGDRFWIQAEEIVNDLVEKYKDKMESLPVGPIVLKKLRVEMVSGYIFCIDFQVTGENGNISNYYAEVWVRPGAGGVEHRCLEKVIRAGSSKKKKEVVTLFTTKPQLTLNNQEVFDGMDEDSIELVFGKNYRKLRSLGFQIFLKEEKEGNIGNLTYATVRKAASRLWRELREIDRFSYMIAAAKKLKEKWLKEKETLSDACVQHEAQAQVHSECCDG